MKLQVIDTYCKENNVARGTLLANAALTVINSKGGIRCDFCGKPAIGKYNVEVYNIDTGSSSAIKNLCENHFKIASKEGEVSEV